MEQLPLKIKFWGVRGSVPSPLVTSDLKQKAKQLLERYRLLGHPDDIEQFLLLDPVACACATTFGGNTSCVEVDYGPQINLLDMGTGSRLFGMSRIPQLLDEKELTINVFISHVHWDHIQGLPFCGPLHFNKEEGWLLTWRFHGGTSWQETAEVCLRVQMEHSRFPVTWEEIMQTTHKMQFERLHHLKTFKPDENGPTVQCGRLNHPQETYGWRMTTPDGRIVVYTTDNEPYDPMSPDPRLVSLAKGADVWITDCQYTKDQYEGKGGVPRHGWGHSYPEAVAKTAQAAGVKTVVLFHHDPASSDQRIVQIEKHTRDLIGDNHVDVVAAWEGLEIKI